MTTCSGASRSRRLRVESAGRERPAVCLTLRANRQERSARGLTFSLDTLPVPLPNISLYQPETTAAVPIIKDYIAAAVAAAKAAALRAEAAANETVGVWRARSAPLYPRKDRM